MPSKPSWPQSNPPSLQPVGDCAVRVALGEAIDLPTNQRVHALANWLGQHPLPGLGEAVPGYAALLVYYDPLQLDYPAASACLQQAIQAAQEMEPPTPRRVEIPTRYGGEFGPDLDETARLHGLNPQEVVRLHCAVDYCVYFIGFMPGFAYLGDLDARLETPRLATPRLRLPAGSVGIAGRQTGVYPFASPGGWRILGRTELELFNPTHDPPALLQPGDLVRFVDLG